MAGRAANRRGPSRPAAQIAAHVEEFLPPLPPNLVAVEAPQFVKRVLDGVAGGGDGGAGSRWAPPVGSGMMVSMTPKRTMSCAVIFMLVAASCALAVSRQRIEAAPSGEMTL